MHESSICNIIISIESRYNYNLISEFRDEINDNTNKMESTGMFSNGYALLESECLRVINSVGLDAHVGFLHEMTPSKNSLAYDLQEPFRFLVDLAVISLVESGAMEPKGFHKN